MKLVHGLRFIILQSILVGNIIAMWLIGLADKPFHGASTYLCSAVLFVFAIGLFCVWRKKWDDVQWIASRVLRLGLLGTIIGLIMAFSAAGSSNTTDPEAMRALLLHVLDGMYLGLWASFFGIFSNIWLGLNVRLLGGDSA